MKRLAILTVLLLAGCGESSDGYQFGPKEFERNPTEITIVTHPSLADLRAKAPKEAAQPENRELMGWSIIRAGGCEVHIVDPDVAWQPQWLGHEAAHCVWGRWHP